MCLFFVLIDILNYSTRGKRSYNEAFFVEEKQQPTESQLDDISENIARDWKKVGRKLNLQERDLNEINMNFRDDTEQEKAFQMLLTWRERYPDQFTSGRLNKVLRQCNLKYTADTFFS